MVLQGRLQPGVPPSGRIVVAQLKNFGIGPDIRAVQSHVKRNIADYLDLTFPRESLEEVLLAEEEILEKLMCLN